MSKNKNKNKPNEEREINLEESSPVVENPQSAPPEPEEYVEEPSRHEEPVRDTLRHTSADPRVRYCSVIQLYAATRTAEEDAKILKEGFPLVNLAALALEKAGCVPTLTNLHIKTAMTRHNTNEIPEAGALVLLTMGPPETDEVVIFLHEMKHEPHQFGTRAWCVMRLVSGVACRFEMHMNHRTLDDGRSVVGWVNVDVRNKDEVQE